MTCDPKKIRPVDKPAITVTFLKDGTFSAYVGGERLLDGK